MGGQTVAADEEGGGVGGRGGTLTGAPAAPPPTEGQTYCLRWNNHQTNLVQILHALHEVGSYVDCTIVVDDQQFKAHRVVLAANSPYFQTILQDVPQDHCSIILPGVKGFEIAALLQYMYTGETTVTKSQEPDILRTAKELQVKGLYDNLMKFNQKTSAAPLDQPPHTTHPFHIATSSSSSSAATKAGGNSSHNGSDNYGQHNSSSVISTSTHISPSAAISSSSSPPPPPFGAYQAPYTNLYRKSPGPINPHVSSGEPPLTPTHIPSHTATHHPSVNADTAAAQWPLSPSAAAAAAMLNSVYESATDMNPLKRKKLSAISSMFMNRDTPILRNVLAQANPADSSQPNPLLLPGVKPDKTSSHSHSGGGSGGNGGGGGSNSGGGTNHSFNGSDYGGDKEPLSPHTDRSFDDDNGNTSGKKPEWKRYKQYTRNDMMCAIQCVREGMSALQASRKFGLPSRTLYDKVRKLNINTGRGTHRTPKRSPPSSVESSAAFPYAAAAAAAAHNYGQSEQMLSGMHDERDERKEHSHGGLGLGHGHGSQSHRGSDAGVGHHSMPPTIPQSAAALLDHALFQQADIAGREALHAMALAAAAHAAVNHMSNSPPGSNGHAGGRSPSPRHYIDEMEKQHRQHHHHQQQQHQHQHQQPPMIKHEAMDQDERDADDEDDQVEDLSLARKQRGGGNSSPLRLAQRHHSRRSESPYSPPPPPPRAASPVEGASVIVPPLCSRSRSRSANGKDDGHDEDFNEAPPVQPPPPPSHSDALVAAAMKRELLSEHEARAD